RGEGVVCSARPRSCPRPRRLRGSRLDGAADADGALARRAQARAKAHRGHGRPRLAARLRRRGARGPAIGAAARGAPTPPPPGARYRLLAAVAKSAKAGAIVTAHTLDDQAETVLLRMSRGSGLGGLGAMARSSPLPANGTREITLVRPLLEIPKARLVATLARAKIAFADDASNRDPRFTRARLREVMPALAREGLDARRLARPRWAVRAP